MAKNVHGRTPMVPNREPEMVSAVLLLQRRLNTVERRLEQFMEDTSSMIEDLYDEIKCHKECSHG